MNETMTIKERLNACIESNSVTETARINAEDNKDAYRALARTYRQALTKIMNHYNNSGEACKKIAREALFPDD